MELALDEDQRALGTAARDILGKICPPDAVREARRSPCGADGRLWARTAEMDLLGVAMPEEYGGLGGRDLEMAILLEEAGRVAFPGPLVEACVAALTIAEYADVERRRRWLPRLGEGSATATLLLDDFLVAYAEQAGVAVVARDGQLRLVPAAQLQVRSRLSADNVRPLSSVGVEPDAATLLTGDPAAAERLRAHGCRRRRVLREPRVSDCRGRCGSQ